MNKEKVTDIVDEYHKQYLHIVETSMSKEDQKKFAFYDNGVCGKKQWIDDELTRLFNDSEEPDISEIKRMLKATLASLNETFRDAHLHSEAKRDWYTSFDTSIEELSDQQHRPGSR